MPIGYDVTKNELLHSKIIPRKQTIQATLFILIIGTNIWASLERLALFLSYQYLLTLYLVTRKKFQLIDSLRTLQMTNGGARTMRALRKRERKALQ